MRSTYRHNKIRFWTLCKSNKSLAIAIIAINIIGLSHADERVSSKTNYPEVVAAINKTMRTYHYNPAELETLEYRRVEAAIAALAQVATSDQELVKGFRNIWESGPFSHVELKIAQQTADDLAGYLDTLRIGGGGAQLTWQGDVAVLTVNTMMGLDTIEEIDAAYAEIAKRETSGLIIDLRDNGGGAFAVRPLVSHLLIQPFERIAVVQPARSGLPILSVCFSRKRSFSSPDISCFDRPLTAISGRYSTGRTIIVCSAVPQLPSLSKSIAWEIPIPLDCQNEIA